MSFLSDIAELGGGRRQRPLAIPDGLVPAMKRDPRVARFDLGGVTGLEGSPVAGLPVPGVSDYQAQGYTPDSAAFVNPEFAGQYATLTAGQQQQQAQQSQAYQNQAGLVSALQARMAGQQPSVAQNQLAQSTAANNQAALAAAASGASVDPSLALRNATQAQASNNQNMAGQAATLRAGEQVAGEQELGNVLGGQAQLATQANLAYQQQQQTESQAQTQAQIQEQQMKEQSALASQGINAQTAEANAQAQGKAAGALYNSVGAGGATSVAGSMFAKGGAVPGRTAWARALQQRLGAAPARLAIGGPAGAPADDPWEPGNASGDPWGHPPQRGGGLPLAGIAAALLAQGGGVGRPADAGGANGPDGPDGWYVEILPPQDAEPAPGGEIPAGAGEPDQDSVPALLTPEEVVESKPAVKYFDRHLGPGFLAKLNEVGKLGAALEREHGIEMAPEGLVRLMAAAMRRKAA